MRGRTLQGSLVRFEIATERTAELAQAIESIGAGVKVVSMGRRLEIVKQVGAPQNLDAEFGLSQMTGTHRIGHTRLSTESRVDLSHSQPFWAHGAPDLAVAHNGHITHHHRVRRTYEHDGVRCYTENDSEVVGVYPGARARRRRFLSRSSRRRSASWTGVSATSRRRRLGFAKDPFCLKPLIVGESETTMAIANEEVARQAGFAGPYTSREMGSAAVGVWIVPVPTPGRTAGASGPGRGSTGPEPSRGLKLLTMSVTLRARPRDRGADGDRDPRRRRDLDPAEHPRPPDARPPRGRFGKSVSHLRARHHSRVILVMRVGGPDGEPASGIDAHTRHSDHRADHRARFRVAPVRQLGDAGTEHHRPGGDAGMIR